MPYGMPLLQMMAVPLMPSFTASPMGRNFHQTQIRPRCEPAPGLYDFGMAINPSQQIERDARQARMTEAAAEERHRERHEAAEREAASQQGEIDSLQRAFVKIQAQNATLEKRGRGGWAGGCGRKAAH